MEIKKWHVVDILFEKGEEQKARELANQYIHTKEFGSCEIDDGFDKYDGTIQLISNVTIEQVK